MTEYLKSPLRYPGGKQKDIPLLACIFEQFQKQHTINEYREPFLGGGSILLYAIANLSAQSYWGNDAYPLLMDFWLQTQADVEKLCKIIESLKEPYEGPMRRSPKWTEFRVDYIQKLNKLPNDQLNNAARFFILNRSTASGTTESGGLTPLAYCERFTDSSIERLRKLKGYLNKKIELTCVDYSELLRKGGDNVFLFLDPPYLSAEASALYGKSGKLHKGFDHKLLSEELQNCSHHWLMTIDNSPQILDYYSWANTSIVSWEKSYSMTNTEGKKSRSGQELLISNFDIDIVELSNKQSKIVTIENKIIHPNLQKQHGEVKSKLFSQTPLCLKGL
jgi:DNA adenine methylase